MSIIVRNRILKKKKCFIIADNLPPFGSLQQDISKKTITGKLLTGHASDLISFQVLSHEHKKSLSNNQDYQLQQLQYNKLLEERCMYHHTEKLSSSTSTAAAAVATASLPSSYTTFTGNIQQRTLFRHANIYPYQDLTHTLQTPSLYFH